MGTYYSVIYYQTDSLSNLKPSIDSLLIAVNAEVSNWEENSTVSRFNRSEEGLDVSDAAHFLANYELAIGAARATSEAFDPTIMPLVNYYGFGYGPKEVEGGIDTARVLELLDQMGIDKLSMDDDQYLTKTHPQLMLDLGGSAKGYGVDAVSDLLLARGLEIHYVEIGGEVRARGTKPTGPWTVGVNLPEEGAEFAAIVETLPLVDQAVATSGNYRNYYEEGGQTFSHTINPQTGFPERNRLLSASVFAPNCGLADAYATACMVLGPEEALQLIEQNEELEAYFLVRAEDGGLEARTSAGVSL